MKRFFRRLARGTRAFMAHLSDPHEVDRVEDALDAVDSDFARGRIGPASMALQSVAPSLRRLWGGTRPAASARYELLVADMLLGVGRRDEAGVSIDRARRWIASVRDRDASKLLEARADALTMMHASADEPRPEHVAMARRAFERGAQRGAPEVLMRLAVGGLHLGRAFHRQGDWTRARALFENTIEAAAKIARPGETPRGASARWGVDTRAGFWTMGARAAAAAALELAEVARTTGDTLAANAWYDRAVGALEGGSLPAARLAMAQACLARAMNAPFDPLLADLERRRWLERSMREARESETEDGFVIVSQAELQLASLSEAMGEPESQGTHLERAVEAAANAGDEGETARIQAEFLHAGWLHEQGEHVQAQAAWAAVHQRGRTHADADVRHAAFVAGTNLHRLLVEADEPGRARELVEALAKMLPGLAPEIRPPAAAMLARARGLQLVHEKRLDDAIAQYEEAVRIAGPLDGDSGGAILYQLELTLGMALAEAGRNAEADDRFGRALSALAEDEYVERAEALLPRARARVALDREPEAMTDLRHAFECGRDSGTNQGRELAALASLALGDLETSLPVRRAHYERAAQLGTLSGRRRGREIAEWVERRLRELADE